MFSRMSAKSTAAGGIAPSPLLVAGEDRGASGPWYRGKMMARLPAVTWVDVAVAIYVLAIGVLMFTQYVHHAGPAYDASYYDLTQSILRLHAYRFDYRPETLLPPGFPIILAGLCLITACSQAAMFHVIAVSTVLGLLGGYVLLRRIESMELAAAATVLLASSPVLFSFATTLVFSDMPYLALSMAALLIGLKLESAKAKRVQVGCIVMLSLCLSLAIMTRTVGLAFLPAICAWCAVSWFLDARKGRRTVLLFATPLVLAAGVQVAWMSWTSRHQVSEWPIGGWPNSYLSQLEMKNGNEPQLGAATLGDLPPRLAQNLGNRTAQLVAILSHLTLRPFWASPAISGAILLILVGLLNSLRDRGGQLYDWYFVFHEAIFALWPWNNEPRFILPIVPLAFLYLWRGLKVTVGWVLLAPRLAGKYLLAGGVSLALAAALSHTQVSHSHRLLSMAFWAMLAVLGIGMLLAESTRSASYRIAAVLGDLRAPRVRFVTGLATGCILAALTAYGTAQVVKVADGNFHFDITKDDAFYPDIEAGTWIQAHVPADAVIMARKQDLVYHYSGHKTVWFPPVTNARMLMDGIRKYNISVIVVVNRGESSYWKPPDNVCFRALLDHEPVRFRLLHTGPNSAVYAVNPETPAVQQARQ